MRAEKLSKHRKAISHSLRQWTKLSRYIEHGKLERLQQLRITRNKTLRHWSQKLVVLEYSRRR
jgi:hypothetical protein